VARIGTDAWFGEIESRLHELLERLPRSHRADLLALITELREVRVIRGRVRIVRRVSDPI